MLFDTNKNKGRTGLAQGIGYFGSNGYNVLMPLNDTQDYDFVIEKDNVYKKVQCKATGHLSKNGKGYELSLRNFGGTKGREYRRVGTSYADILFAITEDGTRYVIPTEDLGRMATITLLKVEGKSKGRLPTCKYIVK